MAEYVIYGYHGFATALFMDTLHPDNHMLFSALVNTRINVHVLHREH